MGLNFTANRLNNTAVNQGAPASNRRTKEDRPPAQFWLNIGYSTGMTAEDGEGSYDFVSLASGIPLDHMERFSTTSRNPAYAAFKQAQNLLMDQIMEVAQKLAPGESIILPGDIGGLQIQIRRVNESLPEASADANPYARKLSLVGG